MHGYSTVSFDTERIPLLDAVQKALGESNLEDLPAAQGQFSIEERSRGEYHQLFYKNFDDSIRTLYRDLVFSLLGGDLESVYVQSIPTFRVHLRNSFSVGQWHRDTDFGHDPSETNYWLPLTHVQGNNSLWIDGVNVVAEYGEVVVFDGANIEHGDKLNDSPSSRVSMDFRTIPKAAYRETSRVSGTIRMPFLLGHYWEDFST
jgi:hypothetical protein